MTNRELDRKIAEIMGLEVVERIVFELDNEERVKDLYTWVSDSDEGRYVLLPAYSADPAACAKVKAWLRENGYSWAVTCVPSFEEPFQGDVWKSIPHRQWLEVWADADTEGRALCLAVVRALGEGAD